MADQQMGGEPPNKRAKIDTFSSSDNPDAVAALLEKELPDDILGSWSNERSSSVGSVSASSVSGNTGVNGLLDNADPSNGGQNDRPQQLSHLLQNKTPSQSLPGPMSSQGQSSLPPGHHSLQSQGSVMVNALTKGHHNTGPLQSAQTPLNKVNVQTTLPVSANEIMSNLPTSMTSSLSNVGNSLTNVTGLMASMPNSVPCSMNSSNSVNSMGGPIMTSVMSAGPSINTLATGNKPGVNIDINISINSQLNDGIPNGPLPGMNRPLGANTLRGQISSQSVTPALNIRNSIAPSQLGPRLQPPNVAMGQQQMPGNYGYTNIQTGLDGSTVSSNPGMTVQRPTAINMPPRYQSQEINVVNRTPQSGGPGGTVVGPGTVGNRQIVQNQIVSSQPAGTAPPGQMMQGQTRLLSLDPQRKRYQHQLLLLLHATKCMKRDLQPSNGEVPQCPAQCPLVKEVLSHMTKCTSGKSCSVQHCSSFRQILNHYRQCDKVECSVCEPVRRLYMGNAVNRNVAGAVVSRVPQTGPSPVMPSAPGSVIPGTQNVNTGSTIVQGSGGAVPQTSQIQAQQPVVSGIVGTAAVRGVKRLYEGPVQPGVVTTMTGADGVMRTVRPQVPAVSIGAPPGTITNINVPNSAVHPGMQKSEGNILTSSPQGMNANLNSQGVNVGPRPMNPLQTVVPHQIQARPPSSTVNQVTPTTVESWLNMPNQPGQFPGNATAVDNTRPEDARDWHQTITTELRNHLVQKLVHVILPDPDPLYMQDGRMQNLINYARKVEADMFSLATTRPEYYQLLAEKIYKIQKQLEEKRNARRTAMDAQNSGQVAGNVQPVIRQMVPRMVGPNHSLAAVKPTQQLIQSSGPNMTMSSTMNNQYVTSSGSLSVPSSNAQINSMGNMIQFSDASSNNNLQNLGPEARPILAPPPYTSPVNKMIPVSSNCCSIGSASVAIPLASLQCSSSMNTMGTSQASFITTNANSESNVVATFIHSNNSVLPSQEKPSPYMEEKNEGNNTFESMQIKAEQIKMEIKTETSERGEEMKPDLEYGKFDKVKIEMKEEPLEEAAQLHETSSGKPLSVKLAPGSIQVKSEITNESSHDETAMNSDQPVSASVVSGAPVKKERLPLFKPDELRQHLMPTLEKLYRQDPESIPFRQPVDPQLLGIPDYFDIIKQPMDLSTIKRKLDTGQYTDPWDYVDDVWLMFDNAWIYNRKTSRVYRYCTKLAEVFEQEIDPVMQLLGYCCGRKYLFQPQVLCCYGKQLCTIPRDAKYFSYQNRYTYCHKCFNDIAGNSVTLGDDPSQPALTIMKSQFQELKNDALEMEPLVECQDCGRKQHQICVLYMETIWPGGFACDFCLKKKGQKRKENKYTAKRLLSNRLSSFIETRVNNFLRKKESGAGDVHVRVLSSSDKLVEVKPGMRARYCDTNQLPRQFPYRAKALFAFEEIDGVDVCFFGMHVQEYGSDSPPPNTRRVYLAYLDSVHFFKPRQYRTYVYHEILLGYLDYVKQLGYTMAHIWACPPTEGDDYIFHCHPPDQRIPKPKRLQDWYRKMLDKGIVERIVLDYKDIQKQAFEDNLKSPAELPYFEGDFWPNVIEDSIKELDQEEEERRRQEEASAAAEAQGVMGNDDEEEPAQDGKRKGQKKHKAKSKSKNQQKNKFKSKGSSSGCSDLTQKIFATMEKHKDVFFVIRLHSAQSAVSLPPIQDLDPPINCELMDGRDAFLTLASERHLEFSSLRRAKFSTMVMLYELHNQGQDRFIYTCNNCKNNVETRYHCTSCDDFDLCVACFKKNGHLHPMIKLGMDLDDGSVTMESKNLSQQESRNQSVQKCINSLTHASHCRDANCRLASCQRMKRVVSHTKACKKRNNGCPMCKQFINICFYHAKSCKDQRCVVMYCSNIKLKLRQQEVQQRLQNQQLMKRRIQQMNSRMISCSTGTTAQPTPSPGPSHVGTKPVSQTPPPPPKALEAVKEIQAAAARQAAPPIGFGKGNPGQLPPNSQSQLVPPPFGAQGIHPQIQTSMGGQVLQVNTIGKPNTMIQTHTVQSQQQMGNRPSLPGMEQIWTRIPGSVGMSAQGPNVQAPGMRPTMMSQQNSVVQQQHSAQGIMGPPSQQTPQDQSSSQSVAKALQELMHNFRNSERSNVTHPEVINMLKKRPDVMAAIIKQRQQQKQQQQQHLIQQQVSQQPGLMPPQATSLQQHSLQENLQQTVTVQNPMTGGMVNQMTNNPVMQQAVRVPTQNMSQQQQHWLQQQRVLTYRQQQPQPQIQQQQQQTIQQQPNAFQQPQAPMYHQRRQMNYHVHNFQGGDGQFSQGFHQQQIKSVPTSMSPQPGVPGMMPPNAAMPNLSPQQLMQSVTSPPPSGHPQAVRSPHQNPSPRNPQPIPSPRSGPVPSPHHPTPVHSPRPGSQQAPTEAMMSQLGPGHHVQPTGLQLQSQQVAGLASSESEVPSMTPQDKLTKLVDTL